MPNLASLYDFIYEIQSQQFSNGMFLIKTKRTNLRKIDDVLITQEKESLKGQPPGEADEHGTFCRVNNSMIKSHTEFEARTLFNRPPPNMPRSIAKHRNVPVMEDEFVEG